MQGNLVFWILLVNRETPHRHWGDESSALWVLVCTNMGNAMCFHTYTNPWLCISNDSTPRTGHKVHKKHHDVALSIVEKTHHIAIERDETSLTARLALVLSLQCAWTNLHTSLHAVVKQSDSDQNDRQPEPNHIAMVPRANRQGEPTQIAMRCNSNHRFEWRIDVRQAIGGCIRYRRVLLMWPCVSMRPRKYDIVHVQL